MIDLPTLVVFSTAVLLVVGSPGPSVAAMVARVIARGWRDVLPFMAAMWFGEVLWLTAAIFGLSALAESFHSVFVVIKYLGIAYLLYLAWEMWRSSAMLEEQTNLAALPRSPGRMFMAGFAVTMGNPKIMVFYIALLPSIVDLSALGIIGWLQLSVLLVLLMALTDCTYMAMANTARGFMQRPATLRVANRISAGTMAGAAGFVAFKS